MRQACVAQQKLHARYFDTLGVRPQPCLAWTRCWPMPAMWPAAHRTALREPEPLVSDWGGPWEEATDRRFNHIEPHMAP